MLPIVLAETMRRRVGPERFGFAGGGRTIDLSGRALQDATSKLHGEPPAVWDAPSWLIDGMGRDGLDWLFVSSDPTNARIFSLALAPLGARTSIWRLRTSMPAHDTNFGWLLPSEVVEVFAGFPEQQGRTARQQLTRFVPLTA